MRALAIDTSTDRASVALWQPGSCAAHVQNDDPARHAETVIALIDRAMAVAGWTRSQLDLVACCVGPGSFTGVRVGVATAKGIALGLDRPIVGVGSLDVMARAARRIEGADLVVPLLDARKEELYWAACESDGTYAAGPAHIAIRDAAALLQQFAERNPLVVGAFAERLSLGNLRVLRSESTDRPDAVEVARLALERFSSRGADDLHSLEPAYVRPPDITLPKVGAAAVKTNT